MQSVQFLFVDSGTGGLSYMRHLKNKCPDANCVYVGDTKNFPYGEKSLCQIETFITELMEKSLKLFEPQVVVIACNTMSVAALETLRSRFSVPFVGTVPAIKLAAKITKNNKIGLLATRHTVEDPYTESLINSFAKNCTVLRRGDKELVSFIEHHLFSASYQERCKAVGPAVNFFKSKGADAIILACTHFIHLKQEFIDVAGPSVEIIDSREGVATQALKVLGETESKICNNSFVQKLPDTSVFVTSFKTEQDKKEYKSWCDLANVPFMGLLP